MKLKPCPFCGGAPELVEFNHSLFLVDCRDCGARVTGGTADEAGETWNRRQSEAKKERRKR